jgi:hypothetical protein
MGLTIGVTLGSEPSNWGTGRGDVPPSLSTGVSNLTEYKLHLHWPSCCIFGPSVSFRGSNLEE